MNAGLDRLGEHAHTTRTPAMASVTATTNDLLAQHLVLISRLKESQKAHRRKLRTLPSPPLSILNRSAPARYTMRTTSQRRRLSEMTIPSGMSMGASGHKTGCSEQSQRGVSKSSYIPVHVVFFPQSTDCLYAHMRISITFAARIATCTTTTNVAHILIPSCLFRSLGTPNNNAY
jgi:hypothetical protein